MITGSVEATLMPIIWKVLDILTEVQKSAKKGVTDFTPITSGYINKSSQLFAHGNLLNCEGLIQILSCDGFFKTFFLTEFMCLYPYIRHLH